MQPSFLRRLRLRARAAAFALMTVSMLVAVACHDGDGSTGEPARYLYGAVHLGGNRGGALEGAPVRAVDAEGSVVATTQVARGGSFALAAPSWAGFTGRIEVDANVPSGPDPVRLAREVRIDTSGQQSGYLWVGVPSTVVSRYLQRNPTSDLPSAVAAVESHLGIPVGVAGDTALGETHRSPVSWNELRAAALAASRSMDAFFDALADEVGAAPARNFRPEEPYPSLARWSNRILQGAGAAASLRGPTDDDPPFFSWAAESGRWITDTRVMFDGFWMGWALKFVINRLNGPPQPDPVLVEIQQISNDLAQLSTTLSANDVSVAWGYSAGLAEQAIETIRGVQEQFLSYTQGQVRDPWLAASILESRHQDLYYAVETLRQQLSGGPTAPFGPLASIYARGKAIARFGVNPDSSADAAWLSMQLRDNQFLAEVKPVVDYYVGWGNLGLNLLAEWAHTDPATFPSSVVGNTNNQVAKVANLMEYQLGSASQPGWNQSVKTAYQLVPPPTIASDDVLVDCGEWPVYGPAYGIGKMISKNVFYFNGTEIYNNEPWVSYELGPWGQRTWQPLGLDDLRSLRARAHAADPNDLINGLVKLGFSYFSGLSITSAGPYFGYLDASKNYGCAAYDFLGDNTKGGQNSGQYCYYLYMHCVGDDDGTMVATGAPIQLQLDYTNNQVSFAYYDGFTSPSTSPLVLPMQKAVVSVTPYGQASSAAFTLGDRLSWTTNSPNDVYASNAPAPDPTDTYSLPTWTWVRVPSINVEANGRLATRLSSSGAALGCMPAGWLSVRNDIYASYEAAVLASVQVTPYDQSFSSTLLQPTVNCFATGYLRTATSNRPVRLIDVTRPNPTDPTAPTSVVWSVTSPSGLAYFPPGSNVLHMDRLQGYEPMQITVTVTMPGGLVRTDTQTCYTQFK